MKEKLEQLERDLWNFIHANQKEHPERIVEASAKINSIKKTLDTVIKHLPTLNPPEKKRKEDAQVTKGERVNKLYLTVEEVMAEFGVTRETLRQWKIQKVLIPVKIKGTVVYLRADVKKLGGDV